MYFAQFIVFVLQGLLTTVYGYYVQQCHIFNSFVSLLCHREDIFGNFTSRRDEINCFQNIHNFQKYAINYSSSGFQDIDTYIIRVWSFSAKRIHFHA